jgi:hypothetical protein
MEQALNIQHAKYQSFIFYDCRPFWDKRKSKKDELRRIEGEKRRTKDEKNHVFPVPFLFHFLKKWNKTSKNIKL